MNESAWAACTDPRPMLAYLHGPDDLNPGDIPKLWRKHLRRAIERAQLRASVRKFALFAAACAGRLTRTPPDHRDMMPTLERNMLVVAAQEEQPGPAPVRLTHQRMLPFYGGYDALYSRAASGEVPGGSLEGQCALLRDVFGNPFRPTTLAPAWLTSDVVALTRAVHEDQAFDRLPILADALQDAGCDDEQVLGHCRGPGPHVRGCWVVDLLLGRA